MWGSSVDPLLATATAAAALLRDTVTESDADVALAAAEAGGPDTSNFDLILLSDLIFNHSQVRHNHHHHHHDLSQLFLVVSLGMNE